MTMALILILIGLILAYFYLKCTVMASLSTFLVALMATIVALSYYEILANLFVSRGHGVAWAHCGCYVLSFVLSFALLRALRDLLSGTVKIELGNPMKIGVAVVCGLLTGIIVCGNLLIAIGLSPAQHKLLYSRFNPDWPVSIKNPETTFLNTDAVTAGLFGLISRGSLSSNKSFSVLHADYLTQIHLNRLKTAQGVLAVSGRDALTVPDGKSQHPVRIWEIPDKGKVMVIRMELVAKDIQDGGAANASKGGQVDFFPGQVRLICKPKGQSEALAAGRGTAYWPIGYINANGEFVSTDIPEIIPLKTPKNKTKPGWIDMVFEVSQDCRPAFLQFKQNAVVALPEAVPTSDDIEKALNAEEVPAADN